MNTKKEFILDFVSQHIGKVPVSELRNIANEAAELWAHIEKICEPKNASNQPIPEDLANIPIRKAFAAIGWDTWNSERTIGALTRGGIYFLGELANTPARDIKRMRNIGNHGMELIQKVLEHYDLELCED